MKIFLLCLVFFAQIGFGVPSPDQFASDIESLRPSLIALRRDLHMHPELSGQEKRTSQLVADKLRALKFDEIKTHVAGYGVVGLLKGGRPGPTVAYRAD